MLNLFINTWKNYNENGAEGGQWITLPADDVYALLDSIADDLEESDPEFFISDYEYTTEIDLRDIHETECIHELNEEIERLASLNLHQQEVYAAALEIWGQSGVDPEDISEYTLLTDVHTDYELGLYMINESDRYDMDAVGELACYIDYKKLGQDTRFESDGGFTSYGWVERN